MITPPLRIAFAAVFWRIFLVVFAGQQFTAFHKTRHLFRDAAPIRRWESFLAFTPYALVLALLVAAVVTVVADLFIRFGIRRLVGRWYAPAGSSVERTPLSFHLDAGERALAETPARCADRRGWRPGTLVLTDRRVVFYPMEWALESWETGRDELRSLRVEPARAVLGSFVEGVPGRLVLRDRTGRELALAVASPESVIHWFDRPDLAPDGHSDDDRKEPILLMLNSQD